MFMRKQEKVLATNFKGITRAYRRYNGDVYYKIGEAWNKRRREYVVILINPERNLNSIPKHIFEGKVLLRNRLYVKRFEEISE